jgi:hypothetical protein
MYGAIADAIYRTTGFVSRSCRKERESMRDKTVKWWSGRRLGCTSLAVSLAEILVIYGVVVIVQTSQQPHMPLVRKVVDITYLGGGLGSFGFAVAGVVADSHRRTAVVALIAAIVAFLVCGLQMLA